jgi:hypothetical protein
MRRYITAQLPCPVTRMKVTARMVIKKVDERQFSFW